MLINCCNIVCIFDTFIIVLNNFPQTLDKLNTEKRRTRSYLLLFHHLLFFDLSTKKRMRQSSDLTFLGNNGRTNQQLG